MLLFMSCDFIRPDYSREGERGRCSETRDVNDTQKSRTMDIRLHSLMRHYMCTYSTTKRLSPFLSLPPSVSFSLSPSTEVVAIKASVCGAKDSRIYDGKWLVGKANSEEIE